MSESKRLTMPRMDPKIACMLLLQYAEINWIPNDLRSAINSVVEEIQKGPLRDDEIERIYSKWIPVSKELPQDGEWAIFTDGKTMSIERYKLDALDHFYPSGRWFDLEEAIAWMPLPDPYQETTP